MQRTFRIQEILRLVEITNKCKLSLNVRDKLAFNNSTVSVISHVTDYSLQCKHITKIK